MNIKKSFLVALATVTAASVSAFAVSAANLGLTFEDKTVVVTAGQETVETFNLDGGLKVTVAIPADSVKEGEYTLHTAVVADAQVEAGFDAVCTNDYKDVLEVALKGEEDVATNVKVTVAADKGYDVAYLVNVDGTFEQIQTANDENGMSFTVANGSKVVVAKKTADQKNDDKKDDSNGNNNTNNNGNNNTNNNTNNNGSNGSNGNNANNGKGNSIATGDNGAATATVFAVMGVVALGTAVAATKMKKAEK